MDLLNTKHKKKSAAITATILLLILLGIFNLGMRYLDPPAEYGVRINFGNSDVGSQTAVNNTQPKVSKPIKEEITKVEEETSTPTQKEITEEKLLTQDKVDAPEIKKSIDKKEEKTIEKPVVKETPKEVKKTEKPKPSKETQDALNNLLNSNPSNEKQQNEGDNLANGTKGAQNGDPNSNKYYGNTGSGGNSNYNLAGRNAITKPIEKPNCNEEGIVVVSIKVDKNGKVIEAIPGAQGTTNTEPCLFEPAKRAALRTTWNPDKDAPSIQKGTIIYKFSLSE